MKRTKKVPQGKKPKRKINIDFEAPCPPTAKQLAFIDDIECYTGRAFTGETLEEASEYIDSNIEDYREEKQRDEYGIEYENDSGMQTNYPGFKAYY